MKPRVVIVDDDAENCRALGELLATEGFDVVPFPTGEAAWAALRTSEVGPDALVADMRMPGLDGLALLRRVRSRFARLPVILVSAFPDESVWAEAILAGAVDVFPKPIRGLALVTLLQEVIRLDRGSVQP
jgi:CheY-like chemotaxis protein